ncbi:hypothetical protein EDF24_0715 [Curtobacterium sp. PhB130]|uniref:hypothetical protein n=1 Tax=Curtobacterium sp. PhB130 TaxID=2485178 RepID=UPI000F4D1530|nr:hypothetical protein [Curtobacterium sp. PhB130]ROS77946.1 hypothetical protein EDF24_0715 [Curtobacterium sp. PhB130]
MATTTNAQPTAPKVEEFDRKTITRSIARLRHEISGLVDDSYRSRPFYASSKEDAVAKRDAAIALLNQASEKIDAIKKDGN